MVINYKAPGLIFPYMPCPFGSFVFTGVHSPTPFSCSDPFFQVQLSNGRCVSPGIQMMTSEMQLMNKNMVDTCKRKGIPTKSQNRMDFPVMTKNLPSGVVFSDQVSEIRDGSIKADPKTPQLRFPPSYESKQPSVTSPLRNKTSKCASVKHPPTDGQGRCQDQASDLPQEQDYSDLGFTGSGFFDNSLLPEHQTQEKHAEGCQTVQKEEAFHPGSRRAETEINCERRAKRNHPKICRKQDFIIFSKDVTNEDRKKRNYMAMKRRNRVQKKSKTELCTNWTRTSSCTFKEKCGFAHGVNELKKRYRVSNYKTQPCIDCLVENGHCTFGSRCNFCHPGEEIRRGIGSTYCDNNYYENIRNEFPNNVYPFGVFV